MRFLSLFLLFPLLASGVPIRLETPSVRPERSPLEPNRLDPLPIGSVRPEGWLRHQLDQMAEGLCGRLYEQGTFFTTNCGWYVRDQTYNPKSWRGEFSGGWEEIPYWFRSFVKLAILTGNERLMVQSRKMVDGILSTADPDGWYGPHLLKRFRRSEDVVISDIWGQMVMNEALLTWYDYTKDARVLKVLDAFSDFCLSEPDGGFIRGRPSKDQRWEWCVQEARAGDILPALFRLHEITGVAKHLRLADRVWRIYRHRPWELFLDKHNVNFAQKLSYPAVYSRRSGDLALAAESGYWYDQHMATWGQMPRGAFAADENCRRQCTDPRFGTESCAWGELTRSFQLIGDATGETKWADRNEDILFNHAPAAYCNGWKEIHYVTACNQTSLDVRTDHNYCNHPPQVGYAGAKGPFRCCVYNAALPYPLFCENLVKRSADGALVFWMYAPHAGRTDDVSWRLETRYPFRLNATLSLTACKETRVRFRVPGWAEAFLIDGREQPASRSGLVDVRVPCGESRFELVFRATPRFTPYPRACGVSVDHGPLTYSVALKERFRRVKRIGGKVGGSDVWTETQPTEKDGWNVWSEVTTESPWNWAVDVAVMPEYRECVWSEDCFSSECAPCEMTVSARRLPEWIAQDGQPAALQLSPAFTSEPIERITMKPLGCQKVRLSVMPQATDDAALGHKWKIPPETTERKSRVRHQDEIGW